MPEATEIAKLIVVRFEPDLPWCVVDPRRWAAEGARGETAMLHAVSYTPAEEPTALLNYVLHGSTVTLTLYSEKQGGSPYKPATLRFDENVTLHLAIQPLDGRTSHYFELHPELALPLESNEKKKKNYPLVIIPRFGGFTGVGLILVEPVTLLRQMQVFKGRDLACQTSGVN